MFRVSVGTTGLKRKASDLQSLQRRYMAIVFIALRLSAMAKLDRIAVNTPRSIVIRADGTHVHMADRWSLGDLTDGVTFDNPAPYAGFVGKEPVDAYGARVEAHYNRELRAELDSIEEDVRAGMETELAALLPSL